MLAVIDTLDLVKATLDAQANFGKSQVDNLRSFMAGSGVLTTGVGSSLRATLENPVGSGRNLYVYSFSAFSSDLSTLQLRINPGSNLPSTARTPANKVIGGPASVALMKSDLGSSLGGGSLSSTELRMEANRRMLVNFEQPLRLGPGVTLGIGWTLGVAGTFNTNVSWYEEDV